MSARDKLQEISKSMDYTPPEIGDNCFKIGKLVRVCSNVGCYEPVYVASICENGAVVYHCPTHGKRKRSQMKFMDITGSTMLRFGKVGL